MKILGDALVSMETARAWATAKGAHQRFIAVAWHYWNTAPRYGIPAELAYVQAAHETNWGKYTGVVPAEYNNWCGLKTTQGGANDAPQAHQRFPNAATGVLAHIQHLARYAGAQRVPAGDVLVDPRWDAVTKFTDTVEGLGGAWAPSLTYGAGLVRLTDDLRAFGATNGGAPMVAQIPGFTWYPANADHYDTGRDGIRIRGGAQHYTAGTNSLDWLAKNSSPPVSVHFLIKHTPTLADRGWQLVRIEDTAWTTAQANPYTVAVEYEHDGTQPIPDEAYEVLAQSWVEIDRYVRDRGLGEITTVAGHKVWVNNPTLICPDGIDVARIVARIAELQAPPPADEPVRLNGFEIVRGFKGFWNELAGCERTLPYRVLGLPLANEVGAGDGLAYQEFERGWLKWQRDLPAPFHIHLAFKGEYPGG